MRQSTSVVAAAFLTAVIAGGFAQAQSAKAPPAYVVIEFTVKDADGFRAYSQKAPATVTQYGGKFMVRGPKPDGLKGDVPKGPFIVLAFESADQARKWASSAEYTALVPLRDQSADTRAFIVEGVAP
jgi:uncharacterized protein (DUF1330 family)